MKSTASIAVALIVFFGVVLRVGAQYAAPPPAPDGQILQPAQLDQLLGPIALYPDPLISEILPAASQPSQIVLADNYVTQGGDPNAADQQPWDDSVKALARYPDVLRYLAANLQWTIQLGQAFVNQPDDVMDSIQRLRTQAQAIGNLQTTPQETVENDDGDIEIVPTNPDYVYVPTYDAGLIFYQPGCGIVYGPAFRIGLWLHHDFDWHNHHVFVWGRDHPRPNNWWHEKPAQRREAFSRAPVWHPEQRNVGRASVAARHDRGFEPAQVRRVEPAARVEPREAPREAPHEVRPAPNPVQVHTIPARPTVSAFINVQSAPAARAASSRGAESRPTFSRPAPSAPVSHPSAPSGGGSGGGGGGRKK